MTDLHGKMNLAKKKKSNSLLRDNPLAALNREMKGLSNSWNIGDDELDNDLNAIDVDKHREKHRFSVIEVASNPNSDLDDNKVFPCILYEDKVKIEQKSIKVSTTNQKQLENEIFSICEQMDKVNDEHSFEYGNVLKTIEKEKESKSWEKSEDSTNPKEQGYSAVLKSLGRDKKFELNKCENDSNSGSKHDDNNFYKYD